MLLSPLSNVRPRSKSSSCRGRDTGAAAPRPRCSPFVAEPRLTRGCQSSDVETSSRLRLVNAAPLFSGGRRLVGPPPPCSATPTLPPVRDARLPLSVPACNAPGSRCPPSVVPPRGRLAPSREILNWAFPPSAQLTDPCPHGAASASPAAADIVFSRATLGGTLSVPSASEPVCLALLRRHAGEVDSIPADRKGKCGHPPLRHDVGSIRSHRGELWATFGNLTRIRLARR